VSVMSDPIFTEKHPQIRNNSDVIALLFLLNRDTNVVDHQADQPGVHIHNDTIRGSEDIPTGRETRASEYEKGKHHGTFITL
jgi:hypothetical protein